MTSENMIKEKIFNQKILYMMVNESLDANKDFYIDGVTGEEIEVLPEEIEKIANILADILRNKKTISSKDIERATDRHLYEKGYVFDISRSKKYIKKAEDNYFYYSIVELNYVSSGNSIGEVIFGILKKIKENRNKLEKCIDVIDNLVTVNIVKDNSTRFIEDYNMVDITGVYNLTTGKLSLDFDMNKMLSL